MEKKEDQKPSPDESQEEIAESQTNILKQWYNKFLEKDVKNVRTLKDLKNKSF